MALQAASPSPVAMPPLLALFGGASRGDTPQQTGGDRRGGGDDFAGLRSARGSKEVLEVASGGARCAEAPVEGGSPAQPGPRPPGPASLRSPALPPPPHRRSPGEVRWAATGSAVTACVCARAPASAGPAASPASLGTPPGSTSPLFSSPRVLHPGPVRIRGVGADPLFPSSIPSRTPAGGGSFSPPFPPGSLWGREGEICV